MTTPVIVDISSYIRAGKEKLTREMEWIRVKHKWIRAS